MRFTFNINKRSRLISSMLASVCIIALAIWGWDLPATTVLVFFAICFGFLVVIVAVAAIFGWLLGKMRNRDEDL